MIKLVKKLLKGHQDLQEKVHFSYFQIIIIFDPFAPNTPFLYPLKISFQRVEKGCIGNKFVNQKYVLAGLSLPKRLIGVILWYTFSRTNNFYLFIVLWRHEFWQKIEIDLEIRYPRENCIVSSKPNPITLIWQWNKAETFRLEKR